MFDGPALLNETVRGGLAALAALLVGACSHAIEPESELFETADGLFPPVIAGDDGEVRAYRLNEIERLQLEWVGGHEFDEMALLELQGLRSCLPIDYRTQDPPWLREQPGYRADRPRATLDVSQIADGMRAGERCFRAYARFRSAIPTLMPHQEYRARTANLQRFYMERAHVFEMGLTRAHFPRCDWIALETQDTWWREYGRLYLPQNLLAALDAPCRSE